MRKLSLFLRLYFSIENSSKCGPRCQYVVNIHLFPYSSLTIEITDMNQNSKGVFHIIGKVCLVYRARHLKNI